MTNELCFQTAHHMLDLIQRRELSISELLDIHLEQIERVNPSINAIPTLDAEGARKEAAAADRRLAAGGEMRPLEGLPIAVKDLTPTKGMRTTLGSPIYADFVPEFDALFVKRMRAAGAIIIGKTNVPEFGAGSHTFNPVFGPTRNPYDQTKTAGGSSGGGAAALASGMIPLADGSDLGGSVRNPPNFNNVVGLRPSPGRIPRVPNLNPWETMPVVGPMARTVADTALLLSVLAGPDKRDPISIEEDPTRFRQPLTRDPSGIRIAWSRNLDLFPVEPVVTAVLEDAISVFADLGCQISEDHPDLTGAADIFQTLRAHSFASLLQHDLEKHRDKMKDTVIWNAEKGLKQSGLQIANAQKERAVIFQRMITFFEKYDFLVMPVSQVVPFPLETDWVREINGQPMETYIDWMESCSVITATEHPAISVPAGFTPDGLPVGIQIVAPFRREFELLQIANLFEQATKVGERRPVFN